LYFEHNFSFPKILRERAFTVNKITAILLNLFIPLLIRIIDVQIRICFLHRSFYTSIKGVGVYTPVHFLFVAGKGENVKSLN